MKEALDVHWTAVLSEATDTKAGEGGYFDEYRSLLQCNMRAA